MEGVCRGLFFLLLVLGGSCYDQDIDLSEFSRAILSMTNDTLGVGKMQVDTSHRSLHMYTCIYVYVYLQRVD